MKKRDLIVKPIVITGLMASGKSTIGKKLAKRLKLEFYDSDKVIEQREGLSIVDIYEFKGQKYFQKKEMEVVKEILSYSILVLSTGGGTLLNRELRELIEGYTTSIWLNVDTDILYQRITRRNTRPEFNCKDKRAVLEEIVKTISSIYFEANITIDNKNLDVYFIVDTLVAQLGKYLKL